MSRSHGTALWLSISTSIYLVARKLLGEEKTILLSRALESQAHKMRPLTIHLKQNLADKVDLVVHP